LYEVTTKIIKTSANRRSNNDKTADSSRAELNKSKFRMIEEKLRTQILRNPTKSIDFTLVRQLNEEAARTIQFYFRFKVSLRKKEGDFRHGRFVDRKVQTDPVNMFAMQGMTDIDRFKKFFFAVFYTYMMMTTIMNDALKKKK
jgi:hypothetical protein